MGKDTMMKVYELMYQDNTRMMRIYEIMFRAAYNGETK